jgi:hypothetical protein
MTNHQHPITPPPELVQEWWEEADQYQDDPKTYFDHVATQAARWGADQELEACREWLNKYRLPLFAIHLFQVRRPKPPSLKQQALAILDDAWRGDFGDDEMATIRRAVEALDG